MVYFVDFKRQFKDAVDIGLERGGHDVYED